MVKISLTTKESLKCDEMWEMGVLLALAFCPFSNDKKMLKCQSMTKFLTSKTGLFFWKKYIDNRKYAPIIAVPQHQSAAQIALSQVILYEP